MASMLERMREMKARKEAESGLISNGVFPGLKRDTEMTEEEALDVFGYSSFRPGQKEIIYEVLAGTTGVLGVMATGYGKSALYQIPAIMSEHLTLVISPLISLMKDQVDSMTELGVSAAYINSTQTPKQQETILCDVVADKYKILYVSPEKMNDENFLGMLRSMRIGLFAVDEAHCISQWGHDFRPSYGRLGEVVKKVTPEQVIAVTATATAKVKEDILKQLGLPNAKEYVRGIFRDNLEICIFDDSGMSRGQAIVEAIEDFDKGATGIIYVATRKEAETLASFLRRKGKDTNCYHAGLKDSERKEIQEGWANNGGIVVATSAFGMGIDRHDVRFVIHSGFTGSLEEWYQEIGRAGRDGKHSAALTLFNIGNDYGTQSFLIDLTTPDSADVKLFWRWLRNSAMAQANPQAKTTTINMTQKEMGQLSKSRCVGACIGVLKAHGLVETKGRGKYQVVLDKKELDFAELNERRKSNLNRLSTLVNFYKSSTCRYETLCGYFGDESFSGACGVCDNCQ